MLACQPRPAAALCVGYVAATPNKTNSLRDGAASMRRSVILRVNGSSRVSALSGKTADARRRHADGETSGNVGQPSASASRAYHPLQLMVS